MRCIWRKIFTYTNMSDQGIEMFVRWAINNKMVSICENIAPNVPRFIIYGNSKGNTNLNKPPYDEHPMQFKDIHDKIYYVYHPSRRVDEIKGEVLRWARDNGIYVQFFEPEESWYSPGETCMIILSSLK